MQKILTALLYWLPFGFAITCLCGLVFLSYQQTARQDTYDPGIQLAETYGRALSKGTSPAEIAPLSSVDISWEDLAPWVVVYSDAGEPKAWTETLNGQPPQLPKGALDMSTWLPQKTYTTPSIGDMGSETRFTWQSEDGAREAVVLVHADGGFIAVGRSLRISEERTVVFGQTVLAGWLVTMIGSLFFVLVFYFFNPRILFRYGSDRDRGSPDAGGKRNSS